MVSLRDTNDPIKGVIYGLYNAQLLATEDTPFYIGLTIQPEPKSRLYEHIYDAKTQRGKNLYKERLILKLIAEGLRPEFRILEEVIDVPPFTILKEREQYWIKTLKPKTNISPGGDYNPMVDPEKREMAIEKMKTTKEKRYTEKIFASGFGSVKEYKDYFYGQYRQRWLEENGGKELSRKYSTTHRQKLKEILGDKEYKELVAKERRTWYASLSPEKKELQRKRDSEYRKANRLKIKNNEKEKS